ncbi:hypothetical protein LRE75_03275 [Streptomyces sp. 372A]
MFAYYVPRGSADAHRRLIDSPPAYSVDWMPPAGAALQWGDCIVFGSTSSPSRVKAGGWEQAAIRFRVFSLATTRAEDRPGTVTLVGGHDDFEAQGAEIGQLAEELRLSANLRTVRQLHVPAWLPFILQ